MEMGSIPVIFAIVKNKKKKINLKEFFYLKMYLNLLNNMHNEKISYNKLLLFFKSKIKLK